MRGGLGEARRTGPDPGAKGGREEGEQASGQQSRGKSAEPGKAGRGQLGRFARLDPAAPCGCAVSRAIGQFRAHRIDDRGIIEAHRLGIGAGKTDRIGSPRQRGEVALFDRFKMAQRNPRPAGDLAPFPYTPLTPSTIVSVLMTAVGVSLVINE